MESNDTVLQSEHSQTATEHNLQDHGQFDNRVQYRGGFLAGFGSRYPWAESDRSPVP